MKYTVLWLPQAEAELAALWMDANQRLAVTEAANEIDRLLHRDPQELGESRSANLRILLVPPLGVNFSVDMQDRIVRIAAVWRFQTRHNR